MNCTLFGSRYQFSSAMLRGALGTVADPDGVISLSPPPCLLPLVPGKGFWLRASSKALSSCSSISACCLARLRGDAVLSGGV